MEKMITDFREFLGFVSRNPKIILVLVPALILFSVLMYHLFYEIFNAVLTDFGARTFRAPNNDSPLLSDRSILILFVVMSSYIGVTIAVYIWRNGILATENPESFQQRTISREFGESQKLLRDLQAVLVDAKRTFSPAANSLDLSEKERREVIERIVANNRLELSQSTIRAIGSNAQIEQLESTFDGSRGRVSNQISVLGKRANFNLVAGLVFSVAGVFLLFQTVQGDRALMANAAAGGEPIVTLLLRYYLPNLSMVLIIELVSFFFLRLYSRSLTEVRLAQNELTNIEARIAAVQLAIATGERSSLGKVIDALLATERNFILRQGETTVEIEKERADSQGMASTVSAAAQLLHGHPAIEKKSPVGASRRKTTAKPDG